MLKRNTTAKKLINLFQLIKLINSRRLIKEIQHKKSNIIHKMQQQN